MLAAHREGARTRFSSFADAWDGFAFRGTRQNKSRRATERELLILTTHLEASLLEGCELDESPKSDLEHAPSEHREPESSCEASAQQIAAPRQPLAPAQSRPDEPTRSGELCGRDGWAWTLPVRRFDEYERILALVEDCERERELVG